MDRSDTDSIITPKRKRGERGKGKNNKRKAVEDIINPAKPKRTRRPRDPNYIPIKKVKAIDPSKRSTIAKELGVSTQTLYNREEVFAHLIPFYDEGSEEVKKKGKSLKEFPPLTLFQQFIHRQFETLRRSLPLKDCTPNLLLVEQNLGLFDFEFFKGIQEKTVDIEALDVQVNSQTVEVEPSEPSEESEESE